MSWQVYIDSLTGSGVEKAAVHGLDGNLWAHTEGFDITPDEVKSMLSIIKANEPGNGVHVNGTKFMVLRIESDTGSIIARKGKDSLVVNKSGQAVIIGQSNTDKQVAEKLSSEVGKICDHLKLAGY